MIILLFSCVLSELKVKCKLLHCTLNITYHICNLCTSPYYCLITPRLKFTVNVTFRSNQSLKLSKMLKQLTIKKCFTKNVSSTVYIIYLKRTRF